MCEFRSGARICAPGSYMALGFCLPKSPSLYIYHNTCPEDFTLYRGVCYRWPSPQCQTQDVVTADNICQGLNGRLCTVPEVDRLEGTGCNFDFAGSWALLGLTTNSYINQVFGYCFRDDYSYTETHGVARPSIDNGVTIAWCNAVSALSADAQSNIKAGVIGCRT